MVSCWWKARIGCTLHLTFAFAVGFEFAFLFAERTEPLWRAGLANARHDGALYIDFIYLNEAISGPFAIAVQQLSTSDAGLKLRLPSDHDESLAIGSSIRIPSLHFNLIRPMTGTSD